MGWLAAALILSVVMLGGVWYYTQQDDIRRKDKNKTQSDSTGKRQWSRIPTFKEVWDIEDIRDSVIFLRNGRYSAVIRAGAIDFRMMSETEQQAVEDALIQAALSLSFDVQLYAASEYIDVETAIEDISSAVPADNEKLVAYAKEAMQFLGNIMKSRSTVRRNYIIVSYDGDVERAYSELNRYCSVIVSGLQRARVPAHRLGSSEILNLVYARLNRGSSTKPSTVAASGAFELYVTGQQIGGAV